MSAIEEVNQIGCWEWRLQSFDGVRLRLVGGAPELVPELLLRGQSMVRLGHVPLRIEILTGVSGVTFDECYPDRHETVIDGADVTVVSLARLRANNKARGRPKDLDDLLHLPTGEE